MREGGGGKGGRGSIASPNLHDGNFLELRYLKINSNSSFSQRMRGGGGMGDGEKEKLQKTRTW